MTHFRGVNATSAFLQLATNEILSIWSDVKTKKKIKVLSSKISSHSFNYISVYIA